jgi:transcription initiation factor TFIIIB Brf1 subunit/transcription initiation factor TFIIB
MLHDTTVTDDDLFKYMDEALLMCDIKSHQKQGRCCYHHNKFSDNQSGTDVCTDCGEVFYNSFNSCEWNNYKNDDGSFQQSNQRADIYTSDNPYDTGGSIPGFNKNSFMMRLHYQQTFSHKQKTFWKISEKFQQYCTLLYISSAALKDAKNMWHICMESGKLTRASIRNGLIASCLYYSCVFNQMPVDRQKIIDFTEGTQKGFLKGEKIFMELMENTMYDNLGKQRIDIKENDSFVKYCNILELPFKVSTICNDIYIENIDKLDSVTPKSATAGILFHVVKHVLKLNKPSKTKIANETTVCIPTINKVLSILEK